LIACSIRLISYTSLIVSSFFHIFLKDISNWFAYFMNFEKHRIEEIFTRILHVYLNTSDEYKLTCIYFCYWFYVVFCNIKHCVSHSCFLIWSFHYIMIIFWKPRSDVILLIIVGIIHIYWLNLTFFWWIINVIIMSENSCLTSDITSMLV
jgi:hypothetical protein